MTIQSASPLSSSRWASWATAGISTVAIFYAIAAYSSLTRQIWIDEFLHFALGSHRSTSEAWQSISETLPTFNHGQTGIHMLVDYWLLRIWGASSLILRLPSIIAGTFLLFSVVRIALQLRFHLGWTLAVLASFFCQQNLMYYAGEARPYMPLAAATVGALAYYLVPKQNRGWFDHTWGTISLSIGVLFHPFFAVYWLFIALYTYFLGMGSAKTTFSLRGFLNHCNPALSIPLGLACLALAKFTWLRGAPEFNMDPYQWIRGDGLFATFSRISHFQFLGAVHVAPFALLIVSGIALCVPKLRRNHHVRRLVPPLALIALALATSILLSAISYHREYWILPRQWVASMALCCVGVIWFAREVFASQRGIGRGLDFTLLFLIGWILYPSTVAVHNQKQTDLLAVKELLTGNTPTIDRNEPSPASESVPTNNEEWVNLANANIARGGDVWPIFRRFYARND